MDVTGIPGWTGSSLGANAAVKDPEGTYLTLARWELGERTAGCREGRRRGKRRASIVVEPWQAAATHVMLHPTPPCAAAAPLAFCGIEVCAKPAAATA